MDKGKVDLLNSYFVNYEIYGIYIKGTHGIKLNNCLFYIAESFPNFSPSPTGFRYAVLPGSDTDYFSQVNIDVRNSTFQYLCETASSEVFYGIFLANLFRKLNVIITDNRFDLLNQLSIYGIQIYGLLVDHPDENYEIFNNTFEVKAVPVFQSSDSAYGVAASGNLNNVQVVGNTFFGSYNSDIQQELLSLDYGVSFNGINGSGNEITDNSFHTLGFWAGVQISNCADLKICSNSGASRVFNFSGDNLNIDFSQNLFDFNGGFDIAGSIGLQSQKDNVFDAIFLPTTYARCLTGNCNLHSRFEVRQNIGTEYYPDRQVCGNGSNPCAQGDEFFRNIQGPASGACASQLNNPVDENLLLSIANNTIEYVNEYPAKRWYYENYLYQKLKKDTALVASNAACSTFLENKAATPVGQFYWVEQMVRDALYVTTPFDTQIVALQSTLDEIEDQMAETDSLLVLGVTTSLVQAKQALVAAWQADRGLLENAFAGKKNVVDSLILAALNLNNSIVVNSQFEANRKSLNNILLNSFLQQGGSYTTSQVSDLTSIATQCYKEGGNTVFQAAGALSACDAIYPDFWTNCGEQHVLPYIPDVEARQALPSFDNSKNPRLSAYYINDLLSIKFPEKFTGRIRIIDASGRVLRQADIWDQEEVFQLELSDIKPGILFITAQGANAAFATKVSVIH